MSPNKNLVYSQHVFRVHSDDANLVPVHAPTGQLFFLITPNPNAKPAEKRYFVSAPRDGKSSTPRIVKCHSRDQARGFDNLRLAEAFAQFLNNDETFPNGDSYFIALEASPCNRNFQRHQSKLEITAIA